MATGVRIFECPFPVTLVTGHKFAKGRHRVPPGPDQDALKNARGVRDVTERVLAEARAIEEENVRLREELGVTPAPVKREPPPPPLPRSTSSTIETIQPGKPAKPSSAGAASHPVPELEKPSPKIDAAEVGRMRLGRRDGPDGPKDVQPIDTFQGEPLPEGADDISDVRPASDSAGTDGLATDGASAAARRGQG